MRILRNALLALLAYPVAASAGLFSVTPIRVDLTPQTKAGSVTISNDGGTLPLKVTLMRWTQDDEGKDFYEPSSDLVYFPRELTVEPGGNRTVRVLTSVAPAGPERAYRLFLEEGAVPQTPGDKASRLSVLVKFGVAVYTHATDTTPGFTVEPVSAAPGKLAVKLRNSGTGHSFIKSLTAPGVAFPDFKARYLLSTAAVPLTVEVSRDACGKGSVPLSLDTAEGVFGAALPIPADACK